MITYSRDVHRSVTFGVVLAMSVSVFGFWQFTLAFMILGGIATIAISELTRYEINSFVVLLIEYVVMLIGMFISMNVAKRRLSKE